jgi:CheY-like chemotaxis protein
VTTGREALKALKTKEFDCVVLDLVLPDMDGVQLIETIRRDPARRLPVIIHTAKDLNPADEAKLRNLVESFILKGPESHQQLFDETALFLHRHVERMPEDQRQIIDRARRREPGLAGRKVLIVDDLMDVMMPDMDGYETMRQIRNKERFRKLPIIAITAKAMKGDREKCIEAGASEYISKPVDVDQLVSMMRVWLRRV